jgi:hypothetical protein
MKIIDNAIKTLSEGGDVKINIPPRVYQVYGRQLSITGADGSRSTVALFDFNGRPYVIEGKTLPGAVVAPASPTLLTSMIHAARGDECLSQGALRLPARRPH